jgi:hypothetical protein
MTNYEWRPKNSDCAELWSTTGYLLADVTNALTGVVHWRAFAGFAIYRAGQIAKTRTGIEDAKREAERVVDERTRKLYAELERKHDHV